MKTLILAATILGFSSSAYATCPGAAMAGGAAPAMAAPSAPAGAPVMVASGAGPPGGMKGFTPVETPAGVNVQAPR